MALGKLYNEIPRNAIFYLLKGDYGFLILVLICAVVNIWAIKGPFGLDVGVPLVVL